MNPEVTRKALHALREAINDYSIPERISRGLSPILAKAELDSMKTVAGDLAAELASLRCSVCGGDDEAVQTPDADEGEPRWETSTLCRSCAENAGEDVEEER